ncbi:hypothetical protein C8E97_2256 [Saccharothrix australiensis]|uniref:Uncharacterized protein n=1 Tax=Saccharothrix australiensis TaxID=2072 RepID=A0A495VY63_9PSEU|nr:hypothetical protein C8E97_2256 [Saccharothrix australiensis]
MHHARSRDRCAPPSTITHPDELPEDRLPVLRRLLDRAAPVLDQGAVEGLRTLPAGRTGAAQGESR